MRLIRFIFAAIAFMPAASVQADDRCLGPIAGRSLPVQHAAFQTAQQQQAVRITFTGHSTFLIESPGGISIATDYNDYVRPDPPPLIATMNRAHSTHFTQRPDPAIAHVLRGWSDTPGPVNHDITVGDVRVRNVSTNIRTSGDQTEYYGNSIFIFHVAGLCIAHLGHLHHTLSQRQLQALGPIDVVLVPVDGSWTLNIDGMIEVLKQINAQVMIPMHYFGQGSLNRFMDKASSIYAVSRERTSTWVAQRAQLPDRPTILILTPEK